MSEGFVKLYSSILDSSVWTMHDAETRIVWITMLAMADASGVVHSSVPGIAARAHVSIEKTKIALEIFQDVDEYSRSEEFDGRRVAKHGRDWIILNFEYFRKKQVDENIRESKRNWWHKNKNKKLEDARGELEPARDALEPPSASVSVSASASVSASVSTSKSASKNFEYSEEFEKFWNAYPKKKNKKNAYVAWNKATDRPENIVEHIELHKKSREWLSDGGKYIPYPATWLNAGGWDDEITPQQPRKINPNKQYERYTAAEQAQMRTQEFLERALVAAREQDRAEARLDEFGYPDGSQEPQDAVVIIGADDGW